MTKRTYIIAGIAAGILILGGIVAWQLFGKDGSMGDSGNSSQQTSTEEPLDIALNFYDKWLEAAKSTSTDPYTASLATYPLLSKQLSDRLVSAQEDFKSGNDPVLCQTQVPEKIAAKYVYQLDDKAQVLVLSRGEPKLPGQAVVTMKHSNDGWWIDDIECSNGDAAPIQEFSFDHTGFLLKSVVPPLDSNFWHLIFEENEEKGHAAQLNFTEESICIELNGAAGICDPSQFIEPSKALIQGEITDTGVVVKKLTHQE